MKQKTLTTLTIKVGKEEYEILYSGIIDEAQMRKSMRHDFRIMKVLLHDDKAYGLFRRLLLPVIRYRNRQLKKQRKANKQ